MKIRYIAGVYTAVMALVVILLAGEIKVNDDTAVDIVSANEKARLV